MDDLWGEDEPDWFEKDDDDDDENDDEQDNSTSKGGDGTSNNNNSNEAVVPGGTQHVTILLDCSPNMFVPTLPDPDFENERVSPVSYALAALQNAVRQKIRSVTMFKTGKRDGIGLLLYNTKLRTPRIIEEERDGQSASERKNDGSDGDDEKEEEEEDAESADEMLYGVTGPKLTTVHELLPLAPPGVATVKLLRSALADEFTGDAELDLKLEYCKTDDADADEDGILLLLRNPPLLTALQEAADRYKTAPCVKKQKSSSKFEEADAKQIWIVTSNDDPVGTDPEAARVIIEHCRDLKEAGMELYVWPTVGNDDFDASKFYDQIATIPCTDDAAAAAGTQQPDADEWVRMLESHFKKTRPAYRVPLLLPNWQTTGTTKKDDSPNNCILLDFYNLQQAAREPAVVQIHQETGKLLGKMRQILAHDGGQVLAELRSFDAKKKKGSSSSGERRLRTFVEFGGEHVAFTLTDKVAIKKQCNANQEFASLILLGFKPDTAIPFYHSVEKSYFCYPSDAASADAFAHLHRSMLKRGVVAVGELLTRVTATSRLVVLRPIAEEGEEDEDGAIVQTRPPGMLVVAIPFEDEMRATEPDVAAKTWEDTGTDLASEDLVKAAMNLVQKQTLVGVEIGEDFQNAAMCRFWNYVEHIALDEGLHVDERYDTEIDKEEVLKHAGDQIDKFAALLPEDVKPEKAAAAARKRKIEPDDSGVDWEQVYLDAALSKCKVADLKKKLKSLGEPVTGNKPVLIERVLKHLELDYQATAAVKKEED